MHPNISEYFLREILVFADLQQWYSLYCLKFIQNIFIEYCFIAMITQKNIGEFLHLEFILAKPHNDCLADELALLR